MKKIIKNNELITLNVKDIKINNENPRKTFNDKELEDLAGSIKLKGVLQPILVRIKESNYELVCGERRLRSSILAGLETIPCFVRDLSDDEAFECMIIENLERKDVHPMEEAEAFLKMIKSEKYSVEDIAVTLNRSEQVIVQRLKLNSLIEVLKADFFDNSFSIGHAVLMARQTPECQLRIFEDYKESYHAKYEGYGTCKQLDTYIDGFMIELESAIFDIEANDSNTGCLSCTLCTKRTGANQLLFSDLEESDKCLDRICFDTKTNKHNMQTIKNMILNSEDVFFVDYGMNVATEIRELIEENEIKILTEGKDYKHYDYTDQLIKAKGIRVDRGRELTEIDIYIENEELSEHNPIEFDIEKIKRRAIRNLELDQEKNTKKISDSYAGNLTADLVEHFDFTNDFKESMFLYFALLNVGLYQVKRWLEELNIKNQFDKAESFEELQNMLLSFSDIDKKKLLAKMIYNNFKNDFPNNIGSKILKTAFEANKNNNICEIEEAQKLLAVKRIAREEERINILLSKVS